MYKLRQILAIFFTVLLCNQESLAEPFEVVTTINQVMAYAANTEYDADQCLVYFNDPAPSNCKWKTRAVIKTDTGIGDLMCSIAMTALVSGKTVIIASRDDTCDEHNSPIVRYLSIRD